MTVQIVASVIFYLLIAGVTTYMACKVVSAHENSILGLACLYDNEKFMNRVYLTGIFAILFLCSALRFGIGNDYLNYIETAHEASVGGYVVTEIGFNKLVSFIYFLFGGEYYEIVFALFAFVTLIIFLKVMYEQSDSFALSFIMFMTMGLYFQTFNTMRYYFALSLAMYSMRYVIKRDYIRFIVIILFAALFHKSVLIVIPLYILASYKWRVWQIAVGTIISAGCYGGRKVILPLMVKYLYPSYEDTIYLAGGTSKTSIIRGCIIVLMYVWYMQKFVRHEYTPEPGKVNINPIDMDSKRELRMYAQLNLLAIIVYVFFSFMPVVTRIGYYLSTCQILMIPLIIKFLPNKKLKKYVKIFVVTLSVIYFIAFLFTMNNDGVGLLPYKSWLFMSERVHY